MSETPRAVLLSTEDYICASQKYPPFLARLFDAYFDAQSATDGGKRLSDFFERTLEYLGLVVLRFLAEAAEGGREEERGDGPRFPPYLAQAVSGFLDDQPTCGRWKRILEEGASWLFERGTWGPGHIVTHVFQVFFEVETRREQAANEEVLTRLLAFRNRFVHRPGGSDDETKRMLEQVQRDFERFVQLVSFLGEHPLVVPPADGGPPLRVTPRLLREGTFPGVVAGDGRVRLLLAADHAGEADGPEHVEMYPFVAVDERGGFWFLDGRFGQRKRGRPFRPLAAPPSAGREPAVEPAFERARRNLLTLRSGASKRLNLHRAYGAPIVGREQTLHRFRGILEECVHNPLQVVALIGQQGVGKTKVARKCLEMAGTGLRLVSVQCSPNQRAFPFAVAAKVIDELAGDGAPTSVELVGGDGVEPRTIERLTERWRKAMEGQRILVLLDDFHHADDGSVRVVREVVERCRRDAYSGIVLLSMQEEEIPAHAALQDLMERLSCLASDMYTKLVLGPLELSDTAKLVAQLLGSEVVNVDFIQDITDGNPQQIVTLLKFVHQEGHLRDVRGGKEIEPPTIGGFVLPLEMTYQVRHFDKQLEHNLGPQYAAARRLLHALSLVDGVLDEEDFVDLIVLLDTCATDPALRRADYELLLGHLRHADVVAEGDPVRFRKQLYRHYCYRELSRAAGTRFTPQALRTILRVARGAVSRRTEGSSAADGIRAAEAFELLGDGDAAVARYIEASGVLEGERSFAAAARLLARIRPELTRSHRLRRQLLERLHSLQLRNNDSGRAVRTSDGLVREAETEIERTHSLCLHALSLRAQGNNATAFATANQAMLEVETGDGDDGRRLQTLALVADLASRIGRCDDTLGYRRAVEEIAARWEEQFDYERLARHHEDLCRAWMALGRAAMEAGDVAATEVLFDRAKRLTARVQDDQLRWECLTRYGVSRFNLGRPDEALPVFDAVLQEIGRGRPRPLATTLINRALVLIELGRYEDAEPDAREAIELYESVGLGETVWVVDEHMHLAEALLGQPGREGEALDEIRRAERLLHDNRENEDNPRRRGRVLRVKAEALAATGESLKTVWQVFEASREALESSRNGLNCLELFRSMVRLAESRGDERLDALTDDYQQAKERQPWGRFDP